MSEAYSPEMNVYEHGIVVEGDEHPESLRLVATARLPIYAHFTISIVDFEEHSLNERAVHLAKIGGPYHKPADYYEEHDLRYSVLAMLYHLNRLVDLYVRLTKLFERKHPPALILETSPAEARVAAPNRTLLDEYAGEYQVSQSIRLQVYREGDKLVIEGIGGTAHELVPESANTFFIKGSPTKYTFVKNEGGKVTHIVMRAIGQEIKAVRVQ